MTGDPESDKHVGAERLRAALRAVTNSRPVPDAWDDVQARSARDAAPAAPLPSAFRSEVVARVTAIAAALAVVAGLAMWAATRADDRSVDVRTGPANKAVAAPTTTFSSPPGFAVTSTPTAVTVESGAEFEVTLDVRTTDGTEVSKLGCLSSGQWGLAEAGTAEPAQWVSLMMKCRLPVGAEDRLTYAFRATDTAAGDGRPLAPGDYVAIMETPDGSVRLAEVPVTVVEPAPPPDPKPEDTTSVPADRADAAGAYTDLSDLTFELRLDTGPHKTSGPVSGILVATNPSDHELDLGSCTEGELRWGLVPLDDPGAPLPERPPGRCDNLITGVIGPGESFSRPFSSGGERDGFVARNLDPDPSLDPFLGELGPGDYLAVVELPGRMSTVRVKARVTLEESGCPSISDDLVLRYKGLTVAEAERRASQDGRLFRATAIDGVPLATRSDLVCSRISASVVDGKVATFSLG